MDVLLLDPYRMDVQCDTYLQEVKNVDVSLMEVGDSLRDFNLLGYFFSEKSGKER